MVEHNTDVIKQADWVVDLGPEGRDKGGNLIAAAHPGDLIKVKESITARYIKKSPAAAGRVCEPSEKM